MQRSETWIGVYSSHATMSNLKLVVRIDWSIYPVLYVLFSWLYLGQGTWPYSQTTWLISLTASMWLWNGLKRSSQCQKQKWTRFIAMFRVLQRLYKVISMSMIYQLHCMIFPEPWSPSTLILCVPCWIWYLCMVPRSLVRESKLYGK